MLVWNFMIMQEIMVSYAFIIAKELIVKNLKLHYENKMVKICLLSISVFPQKIYVDKKMITIICAKNV